MTNFLDAIIYVFLSRNFDLYYTLLKTVYQCIKYIHKVKGWEQNISMPHYQLNHTQTQTKICQQLSVSFQEKRSKTVLHYQIDALEHLGNINKFEYTFSFFFKYKIGLVKSVQLLLMLSRHPLTVWCFKSQRYIW